VIHRSIAVLAIAVVSAPAIASPAGGSCSDILPPRAVAAGTRPLVPEDLVRLRDIGPPDAESFSAPFFAISPDGRQVAFQLRRADPDHNAYCLAMVLLDLAPGARPRIVDEGGNLILLKIDASGTADFPTGLPDVISPRWSPDGRWIAFLKREGGTTQVWRAEADGSASSALTHSADDVVDFRIGPGGTTILFATRPALRRAKEAIEREGLSGYHYDDRWAPVDGNHPFPRPPIPREVEVLDLASGRVRAAEPAEAAPLTGSTTLIATAGAPASGPGGARTWVSATTLTGGAAAGALHALMPDGRIATCARTACEGASRPWALPGGGSVRFFRREGWAAASTAIYQWDLRSGSVRRLYRTDDVLAGCVPDGETLVCLREASLQPRRLERLDPATGKRQLLFDPNPEFAHLELGGVRRLHWRSAFGIEAIGDLVLPVGYRRGRHYPMVVVQYQTRGFLRGGTGDEYPIQAFANRGYAVLSVQRPIAIAIVRGARSFHDGDRINLKGFADDRSVFSSLQTGVRIALAQGIADPSRVGITGLSNGATTVVWALLHSSLFSAAAMSSCCFDTTLAMRVGPASAREYRADGYPGLLERNSSFWNDLSLSRNARRIRTPILLQLADYEYWNALESLTALCEAGAPVDMFVFPGEHHNKSQPAHRLAVYVRALAWFDYWLRGLRSVAPGGKAELEHWDELRSAIGRRSP
jgi:dipeptidyl aminopeptidase/acylaminoacyl peptidase